MKTDVKILNVNLYGKTIGSLVNMGGDGSMFRFTEEYLSDWDRSALGVFFKDSEGDTINSFHLYNEHVMPFFSNLLPEGRLREYLGELATVDPNREFNLLWALGGDLPGAITITSANGEDYPTDRIYRLQINGDSWKPLRFSLAGAQLKFSAKYNPNGKLTIPESGGDLIVKLPSRIHDGVSENEFSMMKIASLMGMDIPEIDLIDASSIVDLPDVELVKETEGYAFVIKRFDRVNGERIHTEDFAQVFNLYPNRKYCVANMVNIAQIVNAECEKEDIVEFVKRLIFNMLIGNNDMHTKNWGLIYHDRKHPSLAPAYDFLSTIPYIKSNSTGLPIDSVKSFQELDVDELKLFAIKSGIPIRHVLDIARETIDHFRDVWDSENKNLPMSNDVRKTIETHYTNFPFYKEMIPDTINQPKL